MRPAWTNSRSRSERTSASTIRATSIQLVTAMMTVIITGLGSSAAANASTRKIDGKDRKPSTVRISAAPTQPPRYPAITPTSVPISVDRNMAENPTSREIRPAMKSRAAKSRPSGSVPR